MQFLLIKVPKNNEYTYEQALGVLSSLVTKKGGRSITNLFQNSKGVYYSLNILSINQSIYFLAGAPEGELERLKNQILAQYGTSEISLIKSFEDLGLTNYENLNFGEIDLDADQFLPIRTIDDFQDVDPISSILSEMARAVDPNAIYWMQIILSPANQSWQKKSFRKISALSGVEGISQSTQNRIASMQTKLKFNGYNANIRIATNNVANTSSLINAFSVFANPAGNRFTYKKANFLTSEKLKKSLINHEPYGNTLILNTLEIATIWHMPAGDINIPNIVWGRTLRFDPTANLPIATSEMSKEQKSDITFLGKTTFKNQDQIFGIKTKDRLRHVYIVGKTGSGKSWLIDNMAIEDIRKGAGVAVLDPHGDAIDTIMEYIPKNRINDVCYFNPADREYAYPLNILEIENKEQRELMVSGIIGIFYKLYSHSWGPRLEHILRNVLFTLAYAENTTLPDVIRLLNDKKFRENILKQIDDPVILRFWKDEYDNIDQKFISEAISPILNKVGQFVTSPFIRRIIQWPKSKVKIEELMNNKKIFLCDLSQGKIGEDNSALLGSMIITQIQIAAMNRAYLSEGERIPFYLYVDEFQNFATQSFTKILSEARKYKLGLTLANQYITQIDEDVMGAVFGNIGTLLSFNVGAKDSQLLQQEFGASVEAEDLTTLDKFQLFTRLAIDNVTSSTFTAYSLPLPKNKSSHQEKIIEQSRKRYGIKLV